jgi:hypothetical protein
MGDTSKPGHIQVLGEELNIEELIRTEGFPYSLLGYRVARMSLIFAEKDQNPFRLSLPRCIQ